MNKLKTQGSRHGKCNICGNFGNLTQDHVPPKGSIKPKKVGIRKITQLDEKRVNPRIHRISQNGLKFKTLCSKCNNERLGGDFDPSLNNMSCDVAQLIRSERWLELPPKFKVKLQPQKIARAIIGHLLAAEIRENMSFELTSAPMPNQMRKYFLDYSADFPEQFNLYFWPYRAQRQVVMRGFGVFDIASGNYSAIGDMLKYFPFAFWLTHETPEEIKTNMKDREIPVRGAGFDEWTTVQFSSRTNNTFRPDWPESPDENEALLLNDENCYFAEQI